MVNDVLRKELVFNYGVPQGSVLGPILFIIYINSICDSQTDGSIFTYADDTCLLYSDTSWHSVYAKASTGLNQIIRKLNTKKITLNLDKTEFIAFSIYSCQSPFDVIEITDNIHNHNGCKIKRVTRVRYLGLIFDQNMKWQLHINSMYGFGAIILQKDCVNLLHPIYFMSKKTTQAQQRYHSYELEVLAIVEAVKKFRSYLLGQQFKIITDCAAFTKTLEKKELPTRIAH